MTPPGPLTPDTPASPTPAFPDTGAPQPDPPTPDEPGTMIATPEGDNEYAPDQPLSANPPEPTRPRGNEAHTTLPLRPALDPAT